ncbi:MAG: hypothetical protein GC160_17575 [Acidobacteria bacterium]|nr:hypothetical protein [Acidobacteriota bacterium]
MAVERQLEFFPAQPRTAEQRLALIRKRLEGLWFRQRAREERRRRMQEKRRAREAGVPEAQARQLTLDEMIERSRLIERARAEQLTLSPR